MSDIPTQSYVALTRGDASLVTLDVDLDRHQPDWMPLSERFSTPFEAYAHAARLGYLPEAWDDPMAPVRMTKSLPLYRSVSPGELASILSNGSVMGRGNRFNEFEKRSFVFLGDQPTDRLVGQGEMLDRQLGHVVWESDEYAALFAELDRQEMDLQAQRKRAQDLVDEAIGRRRRGDPFVDTTSPELKTTRAGLSEISRRRTALHADFRATVWQRIDERRTFLANMAFTSAVLRFEPTDRGFHYSPKHGRSGMGEEDEYGFFPGTLHWSYGVDRVGWVKEGRVVEWSDPEVAFERVAEFQAQEMGMGLAPTPIHP